MMVDDMMERVIVQIDQQIETARQQEMTSLFEHNPPPDEAEASEWLLWRDQVWSEWRTCTLADLRTRMERNFADVH
jgi:hypothetical protein